MWRDVRPTLNWKSSAKLMALSSLILGLAGCGASEQGSISLASRGIGMPVKSRAAIAAGLPDGASPVVLAHALGQYPRPGRARRTSGGAR